ncbi:MAG: endo alpha-1,4 polygalactosaminidase [Spirochaetales bacterium]|nr:endo alpha-1,4 polygalactosaminidase [Spirochaetales bacterium]
MEKKYLGPLALIILFLSCQEASADLTKPRGDASALAVYNQAYQENYEPDTLSLILAEAVDAYVLIDPFDPDSPVSASDISALIAKGNLVSAYMSIGTGEDWRSDFALMEPYLAEEQWGDWEGEYYISSLEPGLVNLMKARIDRAADLGFNWLEFDNMDWIFDEETRSGYSLEATAAEGIAYLQELYDYAHSKGMNCMSKNLRTHAEYYDGVTWESYRRDKNWWDDEDLQAFADEGKPVIIVHYGERSAEGAYNAYSDYMELYGRSLSFISETRSDRGYIHFND